MPMYTPEDIGERIIAFLDQALEERVPDRDRQTAAGIMADLVAMVPEDEPGWSQGIEQVAHLVAEGLRDRVDVWPQAILLVAIYLRAAKVDGDSEHPRVSKPSFRIGGKWHREVPVPLAVKLVRALLTDATPAARKSLFDRSDDWDVLSVLVEPLPLLDLGADELALLLRRADAFTKRDSTRGQILEQFRAWASRHADTAKDIVERWLRHEPGFSDLEPSAIDLLIEGVVAHHDAELAWRDRVIDRLVERNDLASWELAAYLACFAWPDDAPPPVAKRHAVLRDHIARMPERLVVAGLRAMWRDAGEHPAEAVQTGLALLALRPRAGRAADARVQLAVEMSDVAQRAAWSILQRNSEATSPIPWSSVLDEALDVPPDQVRVLENLLSQLVQMDPTSVERFLARWLGRHARVLSTMHHGLENMFPQLRGKLDDDDVSRILLACAVEPDAALRSIAIELMSRDSWLPTGDALGVLSDIQVRAFAHEIVGVMTPGRFWISLLFRLGKMRPRLWPEITEILIEDAIPTYPWLCHRYLATRAVDGERDPASPDEEALANAYRRVSEHLEQSEQALASKDGIAELRTTRPAAAYWTEIMQRRMQQAFEHQRRSGPSALLALMTVRPIARGEAMIQGPDADFRVPFAEHAVSVELPIRDIVDPAAAARARREHRLRAAALLAAETPEPAP